MYQKKIKPQLYFLNLLMMKVQHSISQTLLCYFCHLWTCLIFMVRDYDLGNKSMFVCSNGVLRHVCNWVHLFALFILSFYSYRKRVCGVYKSLHCDNNGQCLITVNVSMENLSLHQVEFTKCSYQQQFFPTTYSKVSNPFLPHSYHKKEKKKIWSLKKVLTYCRQEVDVFIANLCWR